MVEAEFGFKNINFIFKLLILDMKRKKDFLYSFIKRSLDFLLASFLFLVFVPLFLFISIIIRWDSKGPVFYTPIRTGLFNKKFKMFKFRTMYLGSDNGADTTSKFDKRITSSGYFLRKFKIDEIPQLINIIKGEMSFIGPRPELPRYTDKYNKEEKNILSVIPGITDYSSIYYSKFNEEVDEEDPDGYFERNILSYKNKLRLKYVFERNLLVDLSIFFRTIITVVTNQFR